MILICSKGHIHDTENISHVWWRGERSEGGNCPEVMSYDRMTGTRRCNCRLFGLEKRIAELYESVFEKQYSGSNKIFTDYCWKELPTGAEKILAEIRRCLMEFTNVKTGWAATSVRGHHNYFIFYKKK